MDVGSFVAALIVSLVTALTAVWFGHWLGKRDVKKAFIWELQVNMKVIRKLRDRFATGKIKASYPILYTAAYEDMRRKGIFYKLPKDLQTQIVEVYSSIIGFNELSRASTYGLLELKPERVALQLTLTFGQMHSILQRLRKLWKL